ncbi:MAG: bL35 family ribosomal protein [Patescibacteria group bacterium]
MKQKSHSGLKKRLKVRKSGTISFNKSGKKHLLSDKSKRAKHSFRTGLPVHSTKVKAIRRLMPGLVRLQGNRTAAKKVKEVKAKLKAAVKKIEAGAKAE